MTLQDRIDSAYRQFLAAGVAKTAAYQPVIGSPQTPIVLMDYSRKSDWDGSGIDCEATLTVRNYGPDGIASVFPGDAFTVSGITWEVIGGMQMDETGLQWIVPLSKRNA